MDMTGILGIFLSLYRKKTSVYFLLVFSLFFYLLAVVINIFDKEFDFRWAVVFAYFASLLPLFGYWLSAQLGSVIDFLKENKNWLLLLALVVVPTNFVFLTNYPFVAVGDEVRDAGLDAMRIVNGQLKDLFGYGNYFGYGNLIVVIASFFYRLFGNSVLSYRFPAALVSSLDVGFFYALIYLATRRKLTAFLGSVLYMSIPIHIFYARTELVVAFNGFWTSVLLLMFFIWWKKRNTINTMFLSVLIGIAANFHAPSRVLALMILMTLLSILFLETVQVLRESRRIVWPGLLIAKFILVVVCFLIGFGPAITRSTSEKFFQSGKFLDTPDPSINSKVLYVWNNYVESVMVLFNQPTTSHFPDHQPLLPSLHKIIFLAGVVYLIFWGWSFFWILLAYTLFMPFVLSASTNAINADHRLLPLVGLSSLVSSYGVEFMMQFLQELHVRFRAFYRLHLGDLLINAFSISIAFYVFIVCFDFFVSKKAVLDKTPTDFLSMHTVYFLKNNARQFDSNAVCFVVSPSNFEVFDLLHYKEQYQFFLPSYRVEIMRGDIGDNEIRLVNGECFSDYGHKKRIFVKNCTDGFDFSCPIGYSGNFLIYY